MPIWLGITLGFIYIAFIFAAAEVLRRRQGYAADFTRSLFSVGFPAAAGGDDDGSDLG